MGAGGPARAFVVTECGLITAAGDTPESLFGALLKGVPLTAPRSLDPAPGPARDPTAVPSVPILSFDPKAYIKRKGLRDLSRTSQLACAAASRIADGIAGVPGPRVGVVFGSAWGSLGTVIAFERAAHIDGPRFVDPLLFTETVSNVPAGQVAIFYGWSAFNVTLSAGTGSGLEAIRRALDLLEDDRSDVAVAGGGDELSLPILRSLRAQGAVAGTIGCGPYAEGRTGPVGGEAACFLVLEQGGHARERGATPLAVVRAAVGRYTAPRPADRRAAVPGGVSPAALASMSSAASSSDDPPASRGGIGGRSVRSGAARPSTATVGTIAEHLRALLEAAKLAAKEIDLLVLSGSGRIAGDAEEVAAVLEVFGAGRSAPPAVAPKAILGETWGASGPIGVVVAIEAMRTGTVPGRPGALVLDGGLDGLHLPLEALRRDVRRALVLDCASAGHLSGLVLAAEEGGHGL